MAKKIRKEFKKPGIYTVECFAHKDYLTFSNAMKKFKECLNLDKVCNFAYSFYKKSHKRFLSLAEFLADVEEDPFRLSYIFDVRYVCKFQFNDMISTKFINFTCHLSYFTYFRWVTSHLSALEKVLSNWSKLVRHLTHIIESPKTYSKPTIKSAMMLKEWLTNKNFLALAHFEMDFQVLFKFMSQSYQRKFDSIIGHGQDRDRLAQNLEEFKVTDGKSLRLLLSKCHCVQTMEEAEVIVKTPLEFQVFGADGCKSLSQYESSIVVFQGVILHDNVMEEHVEEATIETNGEEKPDDAEPSDGTEPMEVEDATQVENDINISNQIPESKDEAGEKSNDEDKNSKTKPKKKELKFDPLSEIRIPLLDQLLANLDKYFPEKMLKDFDLFDQRSWKEDVSVTSQFSQSWRQLKNLLSYFNIKYRPDYFQSFKKLVETLMTPNLYPDWCKTRKSLPSLFWMRVLGSPIEIDPDLKQLVKILLVLPMGSSEAERAFR